LVRCDRPQPGGDVAGELHLKSLLKAGLELHQPLDELLDRG
jgi:hypothetical protein